MDTLVLDWPQSLKEFVEGRISEEGYSGVGEYVRELIVADRKRRDAERLDDLLTEGLESGEPIEATPEFWEDMERRLIERHHEAGGQP